MLDGLFELISNTAQLLLHARARLRGRDRPADVLVMLITTPLTLKGTRSMIEMQRLQPQIRRLQVEYKDDRQKLNEELMPSTRSTRSTRWAAASRC